MEIFINGRFLTQKLSGVQQFAREICKELLLVKTVTILVPRKQELMDEVFNNHILKIGNFKGHLWEQVDLPEFMSEKQDAVLLNLCNTGPLLVKEQAIILHDLAFIINPSWFSKSFSLVYNFLIPRLIKNSKFIFTVSETIKKEISEQFSYDSNRITVITNKVSDDLLQAESKKVEHQNISPGNYFLMVGSRNPRKNFAFVEEVFARHLPDKVLVIAGSSYRSFNKTWAISLPGIIHLESVDNNELKWLYENAKAVISPSLYEGFGIPNLEAFAFNKPLLCSDIPVFKEVCGTAAYYFNPRNEQSLLAGVKQVLSADQLIEKNNLATEIFRNYQQKERASKILTILEK